MTKDRATEMIHFDRQKQNLNVVKHTEGKEKSFLSPPFVVQ